VSGSPCRFIYKGREQNPLNTYSRKTCLIVLSCQLSCWLWAPFAEADQQAAKIQTAPGPLWIRDLTEGQRKARAESKDLLVVFTGHGWCASCQDLDQEVFQRAEFLRATSTSYVFVELDFTFGDSPQERQREQTYRALQKRFLAPAVPMIYLLDVAGVPYAIMEGYKSGTGLPKMLTLIQNARAARYERDEKLTAAGKATGAKRAALLHAGLQAVVASLGALENRGDDPILSFYPAVVAEIRKLDSGKEHALCDLYDLRQKKRDEWITAQNATFGKLKELEKARDYKGAIRLIDAALKEVKASDLRWRLEFARQIYLEWDGQFEAGLQNARRLLSERDRTFQQRKSLLDRESYNLWNSGRIDEALAQHDRRIREARDSQERLRMLSNKAHMMLSHRKLPGVKLTESINVWREYRQAAVPNSEEWLTATRFLALQLQWQSKYGDALKLYHEFINADPADRRAKLFAAECLIALGENETARQVIDEVQRSVSDSPQREDEKKMKKNLLAEIARLRSQLGKQPQSENRSAHETVLP
jgi:thioredoxin-related protein